jgi:hypothetical protein
MPLRMLRKSYGWGVGLIAVIAGCASMTGLDELQKVECVKDCDAGGSGGQSDSGYTINVQCTSSSNCNLMAAESCCGRHTLSPLVYTASCESAQVCATSGGVSLCDPEGFECPGSCVLVSSFPEYPQCKW